VVVVSYEFLALCSVFTALEFHTILLTLIASIFRSIAFANNLAGTGGAHGEVGNPLQVFEAVTKILVPARDYHLSAL
jgi:hypothetical protein